ncbi:MAG: cupin domain-containing protein [Candidatus Omnitrophota bacterium]
MKLYEKIRKIREEKGLKLVDLHNRIKSIFADKSLTYRTLQRIQAGHTEAQGFSLYQICMGLGITLKELKEGTDEEKFSLAEHIKKNKSKGRYIYNNKAYAEILTGSDIPFLALELILQAGGRTRVEKDPAGEINYKKWIRALMGEITCSINGVSYILRKGDSITINSQIEHSLANNSSRKARCIIIQNPRHI